MEFSEAHPVDPGALACCSPQPAEEGQQENWMGLTPEELAQLILQPNTKLDYGPHKHDLHRDIVMKRPDLKEKSASRDEAQESSVKYQSQGTVEVADEVEEEKNLENMEEIVPGETSKEKDVIAEKLKETYKDKSMDMPASFEVIDVTNIRNKVDELLSNYYRKNRYVAKSFQSSKENIKSNPPKSEKFEPSYESQKSVEIITSTKTRISEDTKELEPDSNLTSPDKVSSQAPATSNHHSGVTLNLPRFGAILASPGENNSGGATPLGENAGITTSVSSSKYSSPTESAAPKIVQEILQPILKKVFWIDQLPRHQ